MDYFDWINHVLIRDFVNATQEAMDKWFRYDLGLAAGAAKHSEHMMNIGRLVHSPIELRGGTAENITATIVIGNDYGSSLAHAAYEITRDYAHHVNLRDNNRLGVGIALRNNVLFITQRLKR